jgi:protein-ribulosamine 3-kinase
MIPWPEIAAQISSTTQRSFKINQVDSEGGGCINDSYRVADGHRCFFVKLNAANQYSMFEAEAAGLNEIIKSQSIRAPEPLCWGKNDDYAWIVLEYISINNSSRNNAAIMGSKLAAMHRFSATQFGWTNNNTIGSTPQINTPSSDWVEFWRANRLGYQLKLAANNGYTGKLQRLGEQLAGELDKFFIGVSPVASLLHGDLWRGNYGFTQNGQPIIFDPAVYYGDRETDIAMTELFGGFPAAFYAAYRHAYPLDSGYNTRKTLYNLYHIINHLNLFGGGYLRQAEQMTEKLLVEIH